jgi:hypothetical protein
MVLNALELARTAANEGRTVVLVEGISDQAAIDALACPAPAADAGSLLCEKSFFDSAWNKRTAREQLLARERFPGTSFSIA